MVGVDVARYSDRTAVMVHAYDSCCPEHGYWQPAVTRSVGGHRSVIDIKGGSRDEKRLGLCVCVDCGSTWDEGGAYTPLCCAS